MPDLAEDPTPFEVMTGPILQDLLSQFRRAHDDYGDTFEALGLKGQFSDVWRKVGKLKRAIWDGETLTRESVDEIVSDLFGHILLMKFLLLQEHGGAPVEIDRCPSLFSPRPGEQERCKLDAGHEGIHHGAQETWS